MCKIITALRLENQDISSFKEFNILKTPPFCCGEWDWGGVENPQDMPHLTSDKI